MVLRALIFFCFVLFSLQCQKKVGVEHASNAAFKALELEEITIEELQEGYIGREFTVSEVVQAYLGRIEAVDQDPSGPALNSVITLNSEALDISASMDAQLVQFTEGSLPPLFGVPVLLKDNIDTKEGMPNTAGARAMAESRPKRDAYIVQQLREAGAIILGKTNLSEWANFHSSFSSSGWSGLGGQTKNPYDPSRSPCGSSAGSGVAASANLAMFTIGTETNGSITCPANANGLVGIKPTVGLLSRSGIIPISYTQDTPGPMTRTVTDAAIALSAMVGIDSTDQKTLASEEHLNTDYLAYIGQDLLKGARIGVYNGPRGRHFRVLEQAGATLIELDLISQENPGGNSYQVMLYEFKDGLNKYFRSLGEDTPVSDINDLIQQTLSDPVEMRYFDHDRLLTAQEKGPITEAAYEQALSELNRKTRTQGIDRVMNMHDLDVIISITGGPAWKIDLVNGDNFGLSSSSPAARSGYPNITVPMGRIEGLPVGMSFFGRAWDEAKLIGYAHAFEQMTQARFAPLSD
jgi:amidase